MADVYPWYLDNRKPPGSWDPGSSIMISNGLTMSLGKPDRMQILVILEYVLGNWTRDLYGYKTYNMYVRASALSLCNLT
jgi:hypothetical protein